jgi:hypothetical protein
MVMQYRAEHRASHCHFGLPVRFLLKDTDNNCTSTSGRICTAGCQPLLRVLRFAQNNSMFQLHTYFSVHLVAKTSFNLPSTVVLQQALFV